MRSQVIEMADKNKIALVAHDNKKRDPLAGHDLYATGTTKNSWSKS